MNEEKERKMVIQHISNMLEVVPFTMEYKVVKKPRGIRIIYEVTQEEMDIMINMGYKGK